MADAGGAARDRRSGAPPPRSPLLAHDLAAFHRADVWQGAVATRFGDDLEHWRTRLGRDHELGLGAELLAVADRLDARALAAERWRAGALSDLWDRDPAPSSSGGH